MAQTALRKAFKPIKSILPGWISRPLRNVATAVLTPVFFSSRTGHFWSSLKMKAVSRRGEALPWYTYPAIDFLKGRTYEGKVILEFGGGQSTLWWAARARHVVTIEGDRGWYETIKDTMPGNVDLLHIEKISPAVTIAAVEKTLESLPFPHYDIVVIDGLYRHELIDVACRRVAPGGAIVCDNAEGYRFYEGFRDRDFARVDFFGNAPGVMQPHCTSVFFKPDSFLFRPEFPIPDPSCAD